MPGMSITAHPLAIKIGDMIGGRRGIEHGEVLLDRRRVYILPTRAGLLFAAAMLMMLFGSINYLLQLGFLLTFLVTSMALVAMYHTHRNLARLALTAHRAENVFAGDLATFEITVHNHTPEARFALEFEPLKQGNPALEALGPDRPVQPITLADIPPSASRDVRVAVATRTRGRLPCPRLRIETRFPFGLWQAWAYYTPPLVAIVYPTPEADSPELPTTVSGSAEQETGLVVSGDEFAGVRPYQSGDPLKRVAWRLAARSDELTVKLFEAYEHGEVILDLALIDTALGDEQKLARLCRWVLMAEAAQVRYALHLPGKRIELGLGAEQRERCLTALALYGRT
jgi:uncharacterized protein (DUF58 family)